MVYKGDYCSCPERRYQGHYCKPKSFISVFYFALFSSSRKKPKSRENYKYHSKKNENGEHPSRELRQNSVNIVWAQVNRGEAAERIGWRNGGLGEILELCHVSCVMCHV